MGRGVGGACGRPAAHLAEMGERPCQGQLRLQHAGVVGTCGCRAGSGKSQLEGAWNSATAGAQSAEKFPKKRRWRSEGGGRRARAEGVRVSCELFSEHGLSVCDLLLQHKRKRWKGRREVSHKRSTLTAPAGLRDRRRAALRGQRASGSQWTASRLLCGGLVG